MNITGSDDILLIALAAAAVLLFVVLGLLAAKMKKRRKKAGGRDVRKSLLEKCSSCLVIFEINLKVVEKDGWLSKKISFAGFFRNTARLNQEEIDCLKDLPPFEAEAGFHTGRELITMLAKFMGQKYADVEISRRVPSGPPVEMEFYSDLKSVVLFLRAVKEYLERKTASNN